MLKKIKRLLRIRPRYVSRKSVPNIARDIIEHDEAFAICLAEAIAHEVIK